MNSPIHTIIEYLRNHGLEFNDEQVNIVHRLTVALNELGYEVFEDYKRLINLIVTYPDKERNELTSEIMDRYKEVGENE